MISLPRHLEKNLESEFERYWLLHCPFHTDNGASMLLYKEDGFYICKSCRRMGNVSGMGEHGSTTFAGPTRSRSRSHLILPTTPESIASFARAAHGLLVERPGQGDYLRERGLWPMVKPAELGWWSGWITIPVRNRFGVTNGIYLRSTPYKQKATGQRFTQPKGQSPMLYVPNWERVQNSNYCLIVFGWADVLTLELLGFPAATTTGGKDEFDPEWVKDWRKPLILVPDYGEASSMGPLMMSFGWRGSVIWLDYPSGLKDPNDFLRAGKSVLLTKQLNKHLKELDLC